MPGTAREVALEVFSRSNAGGGFANILLPKALSGSKLDARDRAFTTELVYGALRMRGAVDFALQTVSKRPLEKIPPLALDNLRLGAYQILYMAVPDRAAVNEGVELAKGRFHKGIASFTNALLRRLSGEKDAIPWPTVEEDPVGHLTVVESHPRWIAEMLLEEYGMETAAAICRADNRPPSPSIRTNMLKTDPSELTTKLEGLGWHVEPGRYAPEALIARDGGELAATSEFDAGLFYIQDESSMLAVRATGAAPGATAMDICSGPGGKTTFLGELMRNSGRVVSVEANEGRLGLVRDACRRMGIEIAEFVLGDATKLGALVHKSLIGRVDLVLLDAPCSGLGVLAGRPDARWRKTPEKIEELALLQERLLDAVAPFVKPGGVLVYSVCTLTRREGREQIERFLERHPEYKAGDLAAFLPDALKADADGGAIQILQGKHPVNGMFIARVVKKF